MTREFNYLVSMLLIANSPSQMWISSHLIATFLAMTRGNGKGCRYRWRVPYLYRVAAEV